MFSCPRGRYFESSLKTFRIPVAGIYYVKILYFNTGFVEIASYNRGGIEFSSAKGSYASFNASAFSLVRATSGPELHEIEFDANGGEGEMEVQMFAEGEKQVLAENTFTRENCRFVGWSKTKDGEVAYADGAAITLDADMTLYAVWKRIYRVRLHGNGATTEEGLEWVDLEGETWKSVVFPENLFTEGKRLKGDLSGWLKGWWPVTGVYDGVENKGTDLWRGIFLKEEDIEEWKAKGWMEDIDGVPTVHFYAVWKSEVLVGVHGAYGKDLEPKELEPAVKYNVTYNHYYADHGSNYDDWQTGVGTYSVLPGEQRVVVELDSGFGEFYTVTLLKEEGYDGLQKVAPVSDGGWIYNISSTEGPQKVYLQVRVEPKEETGRVWFKCIPEMTDGQREAWGAKFPGFDVGKVQFTVRPMGVADGGMMVGQSVALPPGTYWVDCVYSERVATWLEYWAGEFPNEIEVKSGKETEVKVVFRPFGSSWVNYCWIAFDGDGGQLTGETLLWFGPWGSPRFSRYEFPVARRAGGWLFAGWFTPNGEAIDNWRALENWLRNGINNLGNVTLKAKWKPVENAATGSGVPVPNAWLEEHAAAVLAANGGDYEAASVATTSSGRAMWEYYVVGLGPESGEELKSDIQWSEGKPLVKPSLDLPEGRVVKIEARKSLEAGDGKEDWTDVTDVEDLEAEGWRFFRVGVELAE